MNSKYIQYEEEINLSQMIINCLRQWRIILTAMAVMALLMGCVETVQMITAGSTEATETAGTEAGTENATTEAAASGEASGAEGASEEAKSAPTFSDIVVKAVLGAVIGAVAVCGYVVVKDFAGIFFGKKLYSVKSLFEQVGIPVLGDFHVPAGSRKLKNPTKIDRMLDKLEGVDRAVDEDQMYQVIAAKIDVMLKEERNVLVVGTENMQEVCYVAEKLAEYGAMNTCEYYPVTDLLENPGGIVMLKDSAVILAQTEDGTTKGKMLELLEFLMQSKSMVVGSIVL